MNELIEDLYGFFFDQVQPVLSEIGQVGLVDLPVMGDDELATHSRTTEGRYKGHSVDEFLEQRWQKMQDQAGEGPQLGGIWLRRRESRRSLFDFAIKAVETEDDGFRVERCDCGFYAEVDASDSVGEEALEVAVRYEADFINLGEQWAIHPTHHLQWDRLEPDKPLGVTETRMRVTPMLPIHFFEFCTRHFQPDVWQRVFEPYSTDLVKLTDELNEETEDLDDQQRLEKVNERRSQARNYTKQLLDDCNPGFDVSWPYDEVVELPI